MIPIPPNPSAIAASLNELSAYVHANAREKGFHPDDQDELTFIKGTVSNIHGEVSEFWEAARSGQLRKQCDKDVHLSCGEEELADIIIRALDTAARLGIDIGNAVVVKHRYNTSRSHMHGGKLA